MKMADKTVLVTGANGFIGRILCDRLRREQVGIVALGRSQCAGPWDRMLEVDLSREGPEASLLAGVDTVFHLASKAHAVAETAADAAEYRPVIVEGTRRMVAAARAAGIEKFIFLSTVKVMGEGNPGGLPLMAMDEDWPHTPQSPYGAAKLEAEAIVREGGFAHATILRPVMVFGSGEKGNLPRMVEAVRKNRFPPLPETGNRRSMIFVQDLVEYMFRAATLPVAAGNCYIAAGADAPSTRQLYDAIRESLGMPPNPVSLPLWLLRAAATAGSGVGRLLGRRVPLDREVLGKLTGSAWYSGERACRELGYFPQVKVRDWLREGSGSGFESGR